MIHLAPTPGAPFCRDSRSAAAATAAQAAREAEILADAGFDALMIENMHDRPYLHAVHGPEVVAVMTRAALAVQQVLDRRRRPSRPLPLGVQVLSGGAREALAIALAVDGRFVRVENFVFAHVADEGLLERAEAGPLLRYRKALGAEHIALFADIKKKHASHALTADVSLSESVEAAAFFAADGVIVTGQATGKPAALTDIQAARQAIDGGPGPRIQLLVGSGVTPETAAPLLEVADALIVGSWFKRGGDWRQPPDARRARTLVRAAARRPG